MANWLMAEPLFDTLGEKTSKIGEESISEYWNKKYRVLCLVFHSKY